MSQESLAASRHTAVHPAQVHFRTMPPFAGTPPYPTVPQHHVVPPPGDYYDNSAAESSGNW